jgi:phosphatidylethanolamine-binding protein (PEBP) family uncharacterized protein
MPKFQLKSPQIPNNGKIPVYFTCDGNNMSPALEWSHVPRGTQSFVIHCDLSNCPAICQYTSNLYSRLSHVYGSLLKYLHPN